MINIIYINSYLTIYIYKIMYIVLIKKSTLDFILKGKEANKTPLNLVCITCIISC